MCSAARGGMPSPVFGSRTRRCFLSCVRQLYERPGPEQPREHVSMKQSSLTTGVVQGMILTFQQDGGEVTAGVGSAAWFRWLEQAMAFTFHDEAGHFTAHKTRAGNRRGGSYWRATRRSQGRLSSYYLGASARLTAQHLRQAAHALSVRVGD